MRLPWLAAALLFSSVALHAQGGPTRPASDSAAIRALDSLWARNYAMNDTIMAAQLMADDFFMTSTNGATKNKSAELGDVRPQAGTKTKYFVTSDVRCRVYGVAGVVTGLAEWLVESGARSSTTRRRYTAVYAKGGPLGWQLVTLHMGRAE